jgi:signal transduction histidine kinase
MNGLICLDSVPGFLGYFDFSIAPPLLFYSYIPVVFLALLLGFFIFISSKDRLGARLFFLISILFSIWVSLAIITWIAVYSNTVQFSWDILSVIEILIYISFIYFTYVFVNKKDLRLRSKILLLIAIIPVLFNLFFQKESFNLLNCESVFNPIWYYIYTFEVVSIFIVIFICLKSIFSKNIMDQVLRRQIILVLYGSVLFLGIFSATNILGDLVLTYEINLLGPIGMISFLTFLSYIIIRFKAFNIKLIATQALVWVLVILIGSQFFFIQNNTNRILAAITLIMTIIVGIFLVRSVKKEVALREDLEIANNNQQSLIHFISHQLKGFFTKSKMIFAGILEDDFEKSSDTLKEAAKEGLLSDDNAVVMIQSILGVANYRKGIITYNMENVDLIEIVNNVCDSFTNEITAKGLELKKDISESPVMILADHTQISQVIKNLIDNSIKYTPAGSIKVSLKARSVNNKKKAVFEVEDTGVGLSESDKSRLFTEGGKGEESLKLNVNSTGYGLYIVKKIVENHHGKIWAESEGRGKGSIFYAVFELVG